MSLFNLKKYVMLFGQLKLTFLSSCFLAFLLMLPVKADVMPFYVSSVNSNSIGVYQAENKIRVYTAPNENSKVLLDVSWNENAFDCENVSASNLFAVFFPKKNLGFLTVVDENDNEDWVQVIYNKNGMKAGWIKKDDEFKFMNWRTFFNLYGRKYGLYYMKDAPEESRIMYGTNDDNAKSIGKILLAQNMQVLAINGNWALVKALDVDKTQKIGWLKWRNISGEIYLFPDIK